MSCDFPFDLSAPLWSSPAFPSMFFSCGLFLPALSSFIEPRSKTTVALDSSCFSVASALSRYTLPLGSVATYNAPSGPIRSDCTLTSLVSKRVKGLPSFPTRNTVAGEAVPTKLSPFLPVATAQTNVEGVVSTSVNPGPARRCPSLVTETPCCEPFSNSSIRDCVHRWVPWAVPGCEAQTRIIAAAKAEKGGREQKNRWFVWETNMLPLSLLKMATPEQFGSTSSLAGRTPAPRARPRTGARERGLH